MRNGLIHKIRRKLIKLRLQAIRVYCLHHVCAEFDAESMNAGDWMQIDEFKRKVLALRQDGVEFISLTDAYQHICEDWIRCKRYAVLTFDDGYASLKEILPWLEDQNIPVTLFINGKYLDGKSYRKNLKERYLTHDEIFVMTSSLFEIGSHGWEHVRATEMEDGEFEKSIELNMTLLAKHPRFIPFHAYTYGDCSTPTDNVLKTRSLIPVYINGMKNYNDKNAIHREMLK